jgi:uncharacterized protein YkwD
MLAALSLLLATGAAVGLTAVPVAMAPGDPATPVGAAAIGTAPPVTPSPTPSPTATPTPAATTPPPSAPAERRPGQPPATDDSITAQENRVVALTNAERAAAGCGELAVDERLRTAARGHSQDMATNDYFSHTSLDGSSPTDRARAAGYPGGVGENIAMGYRTPEDVMRGWMNSDGHRRNILNCRYLVIGVGLAYDARGRPYWTQKFGSG